MIKKTKQRCEGVPHREQARSFQNLLVTCDLLSHFNSCYLYRSQVCCSYLHRASSYAIKSQFWCTHLLDFYSPLRLAWLLCLDSCLRVTTLAAQPNHRVSFSLARTFQTYSLPLLHLILTSGYYYAILVTCSKGIGSDGEVAIFSQSWPRRLAADFSLSLDGYLAECLVRQSSFKTVCFEVPDDVTAIATLVTLVNYQYCFRHVCY